MQHPPAPAEATRAGTSVPPGPANLWPLSWTPRPPSSRPLQPIVRGLLSPGRGPLDSCPSGAPPASGMSPGHGGRSKGPTLPSACSSEFMSGGSSGHGRAPVRIAAPRPPPGQQRQLPPLTAPLCPSLSHRPLPRPATLIGHLCKTPRLRRFPIGQLLHWPRGPSVGRSVGGAKNCRRPG